MNEKTWTAEELEDLAYRQAPMPGLKSQAQVLLFQEFRNLYRYAAAVGMSREAGALEKAKILDAYRINKFLEELHEQATQMWQRIESAAAAYRKSPSVEAADQLLDAIYGK